MTAEVAIVGASGFVGRAVRDALEARGCRTRAVRAPRLRTDLTCVAEVAERARTAPAASDLAASLADCECVVLAAGVALAGARDWPVLAGANGLLPGVVAVAARQAGVRRMVHVSSMAVQGRTDLLDETDRYSATTPYARSKQLGEGVARRCAEDRLDLVVHRPGSVHGADRAVTTSLAAFARSPLASVARPGDAPSPQHLVENVADAVAALVSIPDPPVITVQPSEGITTTDLLRLLGDREPHRLPSSAARAAVGSLRAGARLRPAAEAWARRLELLWFGQRQVAGFLTEHGFRPTYGVEAWRSLGAACRSAATSGDARRADPATAPIDLGKAA